MGVRLVATKVIKRARNFFLLPLLLLLLLSFFPISLSSVERSSMDEEGLRAAWLGR